MPLQLLFNNDDTCIGTRNIQNNSYQNVFLVTTSDTGNEDLAPRKHYK